MPGRFPTFDSFQQLSTFQHAPKPKFYAAQAAGRASTKVTSNEREVKIKEIIMSGQYGEPDWANATKSAAPVTDTGANTNASSGWAASGGENFTAAASNANVAGMSNVSR